MSIVSKAQMSQRWMYRAKFFGGFVGAFLFGWYLDQEQEERFSAFRNRSRLYGERHLPDGRNTWGQDVWRLG